ncbi:hypothetical protein PFTANZ_06513, partial [Plasmodium falciparum Tanzania (2000708)]
MGPPGGHGASGGGKDDYKNATNVKELLDRIGEKIQDIAHKAAVDYISELKGELSKAKFLDGGNVQHPDEDPCKLRYTHDTNVSWGVIHPCDNRLANLFSEESASQCSTSRISGNDTNSGSCAPYRKLQLCDYNLEKITDANVTNTHNLLVDVLLAAKHEGDSLSKYMNENPKIIPKSNVCTVLARSFADIGDIIRGKDLYVGNRKEKEKEKLQNNLKSIFKKIYGELKNRDAIERYKDDGDNFFKLREDWWNINRQQVWKAMTCSAPIDGVQYFRKTCSGKNPTHEKCQCISRDPPTYFDYVPQFLRWFEEWAEEFCRIKELRLQNVKNSCRGVNESGNKRYCSRNGYDCTGTIIKRKKFRPDPECTNCLFECNHYQDWIDNKMEEFKKQKQKCENEIYKNSTTNKRTNNNVNVMYYEDFYKELRGKHTTVNQFLNSLNEENKCKGIEKTDNESKIDFNDSKKTFSTSKYCKPCPECGVKKENGEFSERDLSDPECKGEAVHKPPDNVNPTDIEVLYSGVGKEDITEKLSEFCRKPNNEYGSKNEKWNCYYENKDNNQCKMQTNNQKVESHSKIMKFDEFFIFWVTYMLNDCIDWKKKITKCINNGSAWRCKNKCKNNCKCFEKWVKKKQHEWKHIKEQYEKQPDLVNEHHFGILEFFLEFQFFPLIKKAYGNEDAIEKIQEFLDKKSKKEDSEIEDKRDIIDILLEHELEEAQECRENNPEEENCSKEPHDDLDDEDDLYEDETHYNPCSAQPGGRYTVRVKDIAKQMHRRAKTQMRKNSVVDGDNKLEGDIFKVTFRNGGVGKNLNGQICNIDTKYSNDSRRDGEPCTGKDGNQGGDRMKIGTEWSHFKKKEMSYKDFYLPPRRQHMCTSNLENLNVSWVTENGKAIHSLLGDVILTAKMDAQEIIKRYKSQNNIKNVTDPKDNESACRALRYSFADIADIIRGNDLWDHNDQTTLQNHLKSVFKNIKEKLPGIQGKYAGDENRTPPYKQLREDWWSANRSQVWKAMICETPSGKNPCSGTDVPLDDYIPQRLRWMTEWAEWYCKVQKEAYEELEKKCKECKDKDGGKDCTKESGTVCTNCAEACKEYKKEINKWKKQWEQMELEYTLLYHLAKTTSRDGIGAYSGAVGEKDKPVVAFLQKLQEANKSSASKRSKRSIDAITTDPTTPYSTAAGYIHQELPNVGCNTQTRFCGESHKDYAFRHQPHDHDTPCNCDKPPKKEACAIVEKMLTKDNTALKDACDLKYNKGKNYGWKCVSSGDTTSDKGSICVPPRRRRLYVGKLQEWASGGNTQSSQPQTGGDKATQAKSPQGPTSAGTPSGSHRDPLLAAFVESAAVETFFLWHRYKKIKDKEKKEKKEAGILSLEDKEENPQSELNSGKIPEEFKRQMFYTLGDYRDICVGNKTMIEVLKASGDTKMKEISDKIKEILEKVDKKQQPAPKTGNTTPESWWQAHGPDIWNGMICALTYEEKDAKGQSAKIEQNEDLKNALWDSDKKQPKKPKKDNDHDYTYDGVKLKEENSGTRTSETPSASGENTHLSKFVLRPPYFRYLEEWGESFCRERAKRLAQIKHECKVGQGSGKQQNIPKCSCYGEDCEEISKQNYSTVRDFNCPKCGIHCSFYKKWIKIKKAEYDKQKSAYEQQKKCQTQSNGDQSNKAGNVFCGTLENLSEAKDFLKTLGPCSKNNENGVGKPIFDKETETFGPATNCKPCPKFKTNCQNGDCKGANGNTCKNGTITAQNIQNKTDGNGNIHMRVSDNSITGFAGDLEACGSAGIFEGIRKEQWECGYVCGVDICEQTNVNRGTDGKEYIQIRALARRWVENFLEDYNKIKHKISHCINDKTKSTSICGCNDKCKCVEQWIAKKREEWKTIRDRYFEQYKGADNNMKSLVRTFLEGLQSQIDFKKATGRKNISDFESKVCNCPENSKQKDEKKDIIDCLLDKLGEKAKNCPGKRSGEEKECQTSTPVEDDEEPLEETEENTEEAKKNMMPKICPPQTQPEPEKEDGCKPAPPPSDDKVDQHPEAKPPSSPEPSPAAPPAAEPPQADEPSKPI